MEEAQKMAAALTDPRVDSAIQKLMIVDANKEKCAELGYRYRSKDGKTNGILVNKTHAYFFVCCKTADKQVFFTVHKKDVNEEHTLTPESNFINFTHDYVNPPKRCSVENLIGLEYMLSNSIMNFGKMRGIKVFENKGWLNDDVYVWFQHKVDSPLGNVYQYPLRDKVLGEPTYSKIDDDQSDRPMVSSTSINANEYVVTVGTVVDNKLTVRLGEKEKETAVVNKDGSFCVFCPKVTDKLIIIGEQLMKTVSWHEHKQFIDKHLDKAKYLEQLIVLGGLALSWNLYAMPVAYKAIEVKYAGIKTMSKELEPENVKALMETGKALAQDAKKQIQTYVKGKGGKRTRKNKNVRNYK
jgi:hypothetical protein